MASSAVVGILRALLTGDTTSFDVAMAGASKSVTAWSTDFTKLGLTSQQVGSVITDSLTRSLGAVNQLAKEFSGAGIAKTADEFAGAIARIGGVSQLTESEQARANAVFQEAADKLKAMGLGASDSAQRYQQLADATKGTAESTETWNKVLDIGKSALGALGLSLSIEQIVRWGEELIKSATTLQFTAQMLGESTEAVERQRFAIEQSGGSWESLSAAITIMNRNIEDETPKAVAALQGLGLSVSALKGLAPEEAFNLITEAIRRIPDPMQQSAAALDIFGRGAREILPAIKAGMVEVGLQAPVMSEETVKSLADMDRSWKEFKADIEVIAATSLPALRDALLAVLPGLAELSRQINEQRAQQAEADRGNREFIQALVDSGLGLSAISTQLKAVGVDVDKYRSFIEAAVAAHKGLTTETKSYVEQLAEAKAKLAALTPEQVANLTAALELHDSQQNLEKQFHLTSAEIDLFKKSLTEAAAAQREANAEAERFATDTAERQSALDRISALMGDQANRVDLTAGEWAKLAISAGAALSDVHAATGLSTIDLEAYKKAITEASDEATKRAKNDKDAAEGTAKIWNDVAAELLKASGDVTAGKLADVDKQYQAEVQAAQDTIKNADLLDERLLALDADRAAKRAAIETAATEQHQKEVDKLNAIDEKRASDTLALADKYDSLIAQLHGETVQSQIDAVQRQQDKQLAAVQAALTKELEAIRQTYGAESAEGKARADQAVADAQRAFDLINKTAKTQIQLIHEAVTVGWLDAGAKAISDFASGFQSGNVAAGIGQAGQVLSGQFLKAMQLSLKEQAGVAIGQALGQAIGGNNAGEQIGSAIGTAVGYYFAGAFGAAAGSAIGGGIGGWIDSIHQGHQISNAAKDVANDMHVALSNALATTTADLASKLQQMESDLTAATARHYAEWLQLDQIIKASGGLTTQNMADWVYQTERLFEVVNRGGQVGQLAVNEIGNLMGMFADEAQKAGGLWDGAFKKLIDDSKNAGIALDTINKLMADQQKTLASSTVNVASPIGTNAASLKDLNTQLDTAKQKLSDLMSQGAPQDQITAAQDQITKLKTQIATVPVTTQDDFDRMSRIVFASFGTLVASGEDVVQAVTDIGPAIDNLIAGAQQFGLSGNAAFDELKHWRDLVQNNQPLLNQISGLNGILTTLSNLGALTTSTFEDLEAQGEQAFTQLTNAGATENEALVQMAPFLENVIKLHKDQGFAIDDNTQKLIDEATQQGILTGNQLTTNDILMQGFSAILQALGVDIPAAWQTQTDKQKAKAQEQQDEMKKVGQAGQDAATQTQTAWDKISITIPVTYDEQGKPTYTPPPDSATVNDQNSTANVIAMAVGGVVTQPTLALIGEKGPEAVVPLDPQAYGANGGWSMPAMDFPMPQMPTSASWQTPVSTTLDNRSPLNDVNLTVNIPPMVMNGRRVTEGVSFDLPGVLRRRGQTLGK